ncbi:serine protease gd-like [Sitophilus oryzae]|uniref:Serine protease gd-like n=1 Tax=Sitophilus oryzae TaxID=7048 RepID=A0A6J2XVL7_SITOR|nr:serine protease gd-like [Sitophilus oryzae]
MHALLLITSGAGQGVPPNPCPSVFQYQTGANGEVYGHIQIPYDGSTTLNLGVNVSMKGYYIDNQRVSLRIKLNTPGQDLIQQSVRTLSYNVYFPFQHTIPRITRIVYNNKQYCSGPSELLVPGEPGVTSLWAGHKYFFHVSNRVGPIPIEPETSVESLPEISQIPVVEPTTERPKYKPKPSVTILNNPFLNNEIQIKGGDKEDETSGPQCGVSRTAIVPLILGGDDITDGMFPWLAAMFVAKGLGFEYKCTANLISNKHVITAARCIQYYKVQIIKTEDMLFVFGKSNILKWATNGAVTRGATKISTHPDFDPNNAHADLSIVTLNRPVEFSNMITPICLWEGGNSIDDIVNKKGTVAGWGVDEETQGTKTLSVPVAKYLDMPVVTQEKCLYSNLTYYSITSEETFCAGKRDGNGPCVGDSGAGFMMLKNGKYYLRGLASLVLSDADKKCDLANYVVFCDVAKMLGWVKQSMS